MKTDKPPRAWHKKLKQMFTCHSLEWSGDRLSWVVLSDRRGYLYKDGDLVDIEEVILLWPTGLQDKNGTEIYGGEQEGDIVKMNPVDDNWNDVVIFDKGHFELRSFKNPVVDCSLRDWCRGSSNPCIVIGNSLQHPDLLKKEQP